MVNRLSVHHVVIDFTNQVCHGKVQIPQNDKLTHQIVIECIDRDGHYLSLLNYTPRIDFYDNETHSFVTSTGVNIDNAYRGQISYLVGDRLTRNPGRYTIKLSLFDKSHPDQMVMSTSFLVIVTKDSLPEYDCNNENRHEVVITQEFYNQLVDLMTETVPDLLDQVARSFIVVDGYDLLSSIPDQFLVDGKVVRVSDTGKFYRYDRLSRSWSEESFGGITEDDVKRLIDEHDKNSEAHQGLIKYINRAFITVDTAADLIKIPPEDLVHGKIVRVNRPKSTDDDEIPDIVEDPTDYYKPAYYAYDMIGNQWVLVDFGGGTAPSGKIPMSQVEGLNDTLSDIRNEIRKSSLELLPI